MERSVKFLDSGELLSISFVICNVQGVGAGLTIKLDSVDIRVVPTNGLIQEFLLNSCSGARKSVPAGPRPQNVRVQTALDNE